MKYLGYSLLLVLTSTSLWGSLCEDLSSEQYHALQELILHKVSRFPHIDLEKNAQFLALSGMALENKAPKIISADGKVSDPYFKDYSKLVMDKLKDRPINSSLDSSHQKDVYLIEEAILNSNKDPKIRQLQIFLANPTQSDEKIYVDPEIKRKLDLFKLNAKSEALANHFMGQFRLHLARLRINYIRTHYPKIFEVIESAVDVDNLTSRSEKPMSRRGVLKNIYDRTRMRARSGPMSGTLGISFGLGVSTLFQGAARFAFKELSKKKFYEKAKGCKIEPTNLSPFSRVFADEGYLQIDSKCHISLTSFGKEFLMESELEEGVLKKLDVKSMPEVLMGSEEMCNSYLDLARAEYKSIVSQEIGNPKYKCIGENSIEIELTDQKCQTPIKARMIQDQRGILFSGSFIPAEMPPEINMDFFIKLHEKDFFLQRVHSEDLNFTKVFPLNSQLTPSIHLSNPMSFLDEKLTGEVTDDKCQLLKDPKMKSLPQYSIEKMNAVKRTVYLAKMYAASAALHCDWKSQISVQVKDEKKGEKARSE